MRRISSNDWSSHAQSVPTFRHKTKCRKHIRFLQRKEHLVQSRHEMPAIIARTEHHARRTLHHPHHYTRRNAMARHVGQISNPVLFRTRNVAMSLAIPTVLKMRKTPSRKAASDFRG